MTSNDGNHMTLKFAIKFIEKNVREPCLNQCIDYMQYFIHMVKV